MLATTTFDSSTSTLRPARMAEMAQASPQGPAPTIRRSTGSLLNDLVAPRSDTDIRHRGLGQFLDAVEILSSGFRQRVDLPAFGGWGLPAVEPLVDRLAAFEERHFPRELVVHLAIDPVACAYGELLDRVEHVE